MSNRWNYSFSLVIIGLFLFIIIFLAGRYGTNELTEKVVIDEKRNITAKLYGAFYIPHQEPTTESNFLDIATSFLEEKAGVLRINTSNLAPIKISCDKPLYKQHREYICNAYYVQKYNGVVVWNSLIIVTSINGKIISIKNEYFPIINVSITPVVSEEEAENIVKTVLQVNSGVHSLGLVIYPNDESNKYVPYLAWVIDTPIIYTSEIQSYTYFIDANTGKIIDQIDRLVSIYGKVNGAIYPENPKIEQQVEVPFAHEKVIIGENSAVTDDSGEYEVNVAAWNKVLSNTSGPFAEVYESLFDIIKVTTKSTYKDSNPSWNWKDYDQSYKQEESNLFYHQNVAHDFFTKGDPFDIVDLNYPLQSYVQFTTSSGKPSCNAKSKCNFDLSMGSPTNKVSKLLFFSANDKCEATSLFSDIIYHEYTHSAICHIYVWGLSPYSGETGGMDEGLADYFAASINNNPCIDSDKYIEDCMRNLKNNLKYPEDYNDEAHDASKTFSASLWDVREALSKDQTDELVIRTMKGFQPQTFSEFLTSMLIIDDDNQDMGDGTPHSKEICHAFYENHGIYSSFCLGFTQLPIAIISSPSPLEFNLFKKEEQVIIKGTAFGSDSPINYYHVEFANADKPDTWVSDGITFTGGEVVDDTLATWNINGVNDGLYIIRLVVTDKNGETATAVTKAYIDHSLQDGWPINIGDHPSPTLEDVDKDSNPEIIIGSSDKYNVYIFNSDGINIVGWPQSLVGLRSTLAVSDLNNDHNMEIIGATSIKLYVWGASGEIFDGNNDSIPDWPQVAGSFSSNGASSPTTADLDGDNNEEIILGGSGENKVYVFYNNGTLLPNWPKNTSGQVVSTAAVGDLDINYPGLEVVISAFGGKLFAWHTDGTDVMGWPVNISYTQTKASPVLGDIDNDGVLEVIANTGDRILVWHANGSIVSGWENKKLDVGASTSSPSLGNLNGDGNIEIVLPSGENLYVWTSDGMLLEGWPQPLYSHLSSPAIGDITGDGTPEIVIGSYDEKVYAYHSNGSMVEGWPKSVWGTVSISPALGDLDGDGDIEVVAGSSGGYLYVWDLPTPYNKKNVEWPQFHHDAQHTGLYQFECSEPYDDFLVNESVTLCPGTYYFNDSNYSGVIKINADNLELDCHGATIIGNGTGRGIYNVGHKNVTIKNCIVKNYTNGIYLYLAKNNYIRSNIALGNNWSGIYLTNSNNSVVSNNVVGKNHHGIGLFFSNNNFISSNNVSLNNNIGIYLKYSLKNTILNNFANTNAYGIDLHESSNYNFVFNNTADYNLYFGLSLDTSDSNVLVNNNADYNYYGLFMESADKNSLKQNNFTHNQYGIRLISGSKENKATNNLACFNILEDISVKDGNFGNYGSKNACSIVSNWEESGKIGCTYSC